MDIYKEADKELAKLLGWTDSGYKDRDDTTKTLYCVPGDSVMRAAEWTDDDGEAFRLTAEYGICLIFWPSGVQADLLSKS